MVQALINIDVDDLAAAPSFYSEGVPEIEPAAARAQAAGATLEREIATHEWGRIALMADPFLGRGYDEIAAR